MSDSLHPMYYAQIHIQWVGDAIQPSHPLSPRSPPALSLSQHQGPFLWVDTLHQVAKLLELQLQSFQWEHWFIILIVTWYKLFHMIEFKKNYPDLGTGDLRTHLNLQHSSSGFFVHWGVGPRISCGFPTVVGQTCRPVFPQECKKWKWTTQRGREME